MPSNLPRSGHWQHHTLLLLFTGMWGANFILAEVALREMSPVSFSVARFATGACALFLLLCTRRCTNSSVSRLFPRLDRRDLALLIAVALLGALAAPWLGIEGLARSSGARASLWLALGPVMSVAIGVVLRSERIGAMGHVGVGLAGAGGLALALDGFRGTGHYVSGDILLFLALTAAVAELHMIKPLALRHGPTPTVTARTAIGVVAYAAVASPSLAAQPWAGFGLWTWIAILAGGAIGIGMGQWVKVRALKAIGPTRVVLYGNLVPVAALLIAWLALSAVPSLLECLAAALILCGAVCLEVLDTFKHEAPATTEMSM